MTYSTSIYRRLLPTAMLILIIAVGSCHHCWGQSVEHDSLVHTIPELLIERTRRTSTGDEQARNTVIQLAEQALQQRHQQHPDSLLTYMGNENLTLSVSNFDLNSKFFHTLFPSFQEYTRPSVFDGKWVLPLSYRSSVTRYQMLPGSKPNSPLKRTILYYEHLGPEQSLEAGGLSLGLEELFPHINPTDDNIRMLDAQFPGPLSLTGQSRYRYYYTDTVISRGRILQVISFYPYQPGAFTLRGDLYVTMGATPQLASCVITVPVTTSLNFVRALRIRQQYALGDTSHLESEEMDAELTLHHKIVSIYVEARRRYGDFEYLTATAADSLVHHTDSLSARPNTLARSSLPSYFGSTSIYRKGRQMVSTEAGLRRFLDRLKQEPFYALAFTVVDALSLDYLHTRFDDNKVYGGSLFDLGPITSLIGNNETEGTRLRLGGRTTAYFSPRWFFEGYAAYGFRDRQLKYTLEAAYSFEDKRYFRTEYPRHELAFIHSYDLYTPGQIFNNNDKDNLLYNIGTAYMATRSYRLLGRAEYRVDYRSGLSALLYYQALTDTPTGNMTYTKVQRDSTIISTSYYTDTSFGIELRWAPGERIYNGSMQRQSSFRNMVQREVPVFILRHETALPFFGGNFLRNRTELQVDHRLWMGEAGRLDYRINVGKIWDNVPFPLRYNPPVNLAFALNDNAFQTIYPYEFVADEWIVLFAQWHMRGLLLNRIPWVNRLKLRGVLSTNILYGNTTPNNQREMTNELFVLPIHTTEMLHRVHAEVGFGIDNILSLFRIDAFYRLTPPLPHSNPSRWYIRGRVGISF